VDGAGGIGGGVKEGLEIEREGFAIRASRAQLHLVSHRSQTDFHGCNFGKLDDKKFRESYVVLCEGVLSS
jgi:hypothetical protein